MTHPLLMCEIIFASSPAVRLLPTEVVLCTEHEVPMPYYVLHVLSFYVRAIRVPQTSRYDLHHDTNADKPALSQEGSKASTL